MNLTLATQAVMLVGLLTGGAMAQTNELVAPTNTTPVAVITNQVIVTNVVVVAPPERLPAVRIDTTRLVQAFVGTDAVSKQKVAAAIIMIDEGDYAGCAQLLREVRGFTAITPDQEREIDRVLAQLPTGRL